MNSQNYNRRRNRDPQGWRAKIAKLLAERGPTDGETIRESLGMRFSTFWDRICCHWFEITGKGWGLTRHGREALTKDSTSPKREKGKTQCPRS